MITPKQPLIGVDQWPSVAVTWRVEPGAPAQLLVTFAVVPARPAARGDAAVLARLHHQVHAPPGIRWILHTSLLSDGDDAGLVTLARSDAELLEGWLFGESTSVHAYLHERVRAPHVSPPPPVTIAVALPEDARNRRTLYPVTVQLELRRAGPAPEGVEDAPGLHSAITSIPPSSDPTLAATFEVALSTPEALLRLAHELGSPTAGAQLHAQWAVQIGRAGIATPIAFAVHPSPPTIFAPAPFSTRLLRLGPVPIRDHTTGVGRGLEPTRHVEFAAIDMDAWLAALFAAVDRALAPEFAAPIQTLSERDRREPQGVDHLARIVAAKHRIAEVASAWMLPVRADSDADPTAVRELFRRRLCSRLSNAQATWAAVEFDAAVHAGVVEASLGPSARLFGKIVEHAADGGPPRDTTITWAELALADADHAPLPFLLDALGARRTSAAASVPLELVYAATQIEHGAPGHGALAFVIPSTDGPWTQRLGAVEVPVVLREAPASPVLIQQTAVGAAPDGSVSALARWDCMFTYAMPGQPAQDRLYVAIAFDVGPSATIREADTDRLHPIAEFLTVVPSIHADFVALLPRLGRETQDEALVRSARLAVESFTDLLASAADALVREPSAALGRDASPIDAALSGAVSIHEDEVELPDPTAPGRTIRALRITLAGPSPIGTARVDIDAQRYEPMVHAAIAGERVSYVYVDRRSNALLTAEEARHIETRTFVLPDLDLVSRPCARATVSRTRNEALPDGTPIATPFVYRTPAVSFADPLFPLVDRRDPVDLTATEASPDGDASIAGHLQRFFDALFAAARSEGARRTVSIEVSYEHRIAEATAAARLMIELVPPTDVIVDPGDEGAAGELHLTELLRALDEATRGWFVANRPSPSDGALVFDIQLMSHLRGQPMPSLRLRDVRLPIASVVPPLTTTA